MKSLRKIVEENRVRDGVNLTDEDLKQNFIEESKKEGAYYYNQIKENEEKIEAEKSADAETIINDTKKQNIIN